MADSVALYGAGRFGETTRVLEQALRYEEHFPALDPRLPQTLHALGFVYQQQGRYAEAARLYLRAIPLFERFGPAGHKALLLSMDNLDRGVPGGP